MRGRDRILNSLSRVVVNKRVAGIVVSGPRRNGVTLVLTRRLVLPIQSHQVIDDSKLATTLGHRVPNLRLVGLIQLHYVLLIGSMVIYIRIFVMREGIGTSTVVSQGICLETILLVRFL